MARFLTPAFVGVFVASLARLASAQDGPGTNATEPPRPASSVRAAAATFTVPLTEAIRLDEYLNRLDQWRNEGRITAAESARARRLLNAAVVAGDPSVRVPLDASGRIDLLLLARGQTNAFASTQPGERLVSRVLNEFDIRMRVKPRDLASPASLALFSAAPGYLAVPARDLGRIVNGALESTPVGELPGGTQLLSAIDALPNTAGLKADQTVREIIQLAGDRQSDWLRSRVGGFVENHKIEAGLLAFGAITGMRMASPGAARFMDGLGVRLRIFRASTPDARLYTTSRLVYRNAYVLPEFELESGARRVAGPARIRVTTAAVVGAEALHHARGRVGFGARWERGQWFADTNATYAFPEHLVRTELRGGYLTETGFAMSSAVAATFGHGSGALGRAPGRLGFELDLTKAVIVGHSDGETGLFVSSGADSDFTYGYWRAGLVFRLRVGPR